MISATCRYGDDILEVIYNLHVQESKFGGKIYKFAGKSFKKVELRGVHGVSFFQVWVQLRETKCNQG